MTDATELDEAVVRAAVEGADSRQWAEEWWRCHADDYFRAAMAGCPELVAYFGTITPSNMRLLLDEITRLRAALDEALSERDEALSDHLCACGYGVVCGQCQRVDRARAEAAESALAVVRAGLTEALDELVECRSFISVETRHYPTVHAINEVVEHLRPLATPTTMERNKG